MKNLLNNAKALALVSVMFAAIPSTVMAGPIIVDGINGNGDTYTNSFIANWTNEHHKAGSVFKDGTDETTVWWELDSGLYFLFIEAPIEAKNMTWGAGVTAAELALYDVHNTSLGHHDPLTGLDYGKATGSEKVIFGGITAELTTGKKGKKGKKAKKGTGTSGLQDSATSHDYVLAHGCNTIDCAASTTTMSFEFAFNMNTNAFQTLLSDIKTGGIKFHLSPERAGPGSPPLTPPPPLKVSTPGTLPLMFSGMLLLFAAARRRV